MNGKTSVSDKTKPFRLVKYFTFSSLILIFLGTTILSLLNTQLARTVLLKKSEDYALLVVENLNHQIFLQFVIPVALKFGKIQLRNKEQFERMDKVVRTTLHSFKIESVSIYDMNNIVSYSFEPEIIGKQDLGGTGYLEAVSGKSSFRLIQRGRWEQLLFGIPQESKLVTFAPLRAEKPLSRLSGPVLGVVEIVQDLSGDYKNIIKFQILIIITSALVMATVFTALLLVVRRGERIIHLRNLEQIQLKEQLNRAERLSSLGEMAAGISHEIRNPLGIIRSSAELLKKKMRQHEPSSTIPDIIVEESNRLNKIITDFLDYARPRKANLTPQHPEDILEKNITYLAAQTEGQGYHIHKDYSDNLPIIAADADMLYQAFLNLLINAMQAMPDGGNIFIRLKGNGKILTIQFDDEGTGIPEELSEKIWNPFFTTKETGTGMGLGIVKNIVEIHHGTIQLSNIHSGGTRVTIEFPIVEQPNQACGESYGNHPDRR